jgi:hypothetical protein
VLLRFLSTASATSGDFRRSRSFGFVGGRRFRRQERFYESFALLDGQLFAPESGFFGGREASGCERDCGHRVVAIKMILGDQVTMLVSDALCN